jgi:hypothetical protein
MRVFNKRAVFAIILGIGIHGFAEPLKAATMQMNMHMSFADPASTGGGGSGGSGGSGGGFGLGSQGSSSPPNTPPLITIDTFGGTYISKEDSLTSFNSEEQDTGESRIISFNGPNDQIMNFLTLAYNDYKGSGGVIPVKAICSLSRNSKHDDNCDGLYRTIKQDRNTLYLAMDTSSFASLAPSASEYSGLSALDLCAVYQ